MEDFSDSSITMVNEKNPETDKLQAGEDYKSLLALAQAVTLYNLHVDIFCTIR